MTNQIAVLHVYCYKYDLKCNNPFLYVHVKLCSTWKNKSGQWKDFWKRPRYEYMFLDIIMIMYMYCTYCS